MSGWETSVRAYLLASIKTSPREGEQGGPAIRELCYKRP